MRAITIRFPEEIYTQLEMQAEVWRRSINAHVISIVEDRLKAQNESDQQAIDQVRKSLPAAS